MASMMGGDFVEAYVLKNAYKEKLRRMEEAEASSRISSDDSGSAKAGEKESAGGSRGGGRGGLFGLMKKKVHPGAAELLLDSPIYLTDAATPRREELLLKQRSVQV
jgi:hypothetical protein